MCDGPLVIIAWRVFMLQVGEIVAGMEGDFRYTKSLVAYSRQGVHIHLPFYGWPAATGRNDSILLNVTNAALHGVITV
jgi:hypothetical protein